MEVLKVGAKTEPSKLAGSIAGVMREAEKAKLRAIGAGAVNQAIKGAAIARGFLAPQGIEICLLPGFGSMETDGQERTTVVLEVRKL